MIAVLREAKSGLRRKRCRLTTGGQQVELLSTESTTENNRLHLVCR